MNLEKSTGEVHLRSWSHDLPSCTSRALLQLLSVHVVQLSHAFKELAPATHAVQWQTLAARKAGSPALGEAATHGPSTIIEFHYTAMQGFA